MPTPVAFLYVWNCADCDHDFQTAHLPEELPDEANCDECGRETTAQVEVIPLQMEPIPGQPPLYAEHPPAVVALRALLLDLEDTGEDRDEDGTLYATCKAARSALAAWDAGKDRACICKETTHSPETCNPNCGCPQCWDTWADAGKAVSGE